jgi:hypothetical protein
VTITRHVIFLTTPTTEPCENLPPTHGSLEWTGEHWEAFGDHQVPPRLAQQREMSNGRSPGNMIRGGSKGLRAHFTLATCPCSPPYRPAGCRSGSRRQSLHQTINRTCAAAALPSVIGGPGSDFTLDQQFSNVFSCQCASPSNVGQE